MVPASFLRDRMGQFIGHRKWQKRNEEASGAGEIFLPDLDGEALASSLA